MTKYIIDEVEAANRNLAHLLDLMCEVHFSRDRGAPMDERLDSVLWIARDLAEGINAKLDADSEPALVAAKERVL